MEPDVRITTKEAARLAGVNPKTIRRWITSGRLPAVMEGRTYYVTEADVIEARDNPDARPVAIDHIPEPQAVDITPLLQRLEELTRENEALKRQLAPPPIPWWRRLMIWKGHTHANDETPAALPGERRD